jgi:anoctamin-10
LEVITFFGIFSNAGLIVYTSGSIQTDKIVTFSILLVVFLGIKYFIRFIIPDAPESAMILNKRHQYAVDRVVKVLVLLIYSSGVREIKSQVLQACQSQP